MNMSTDCDICCEKMNKSSRKPVSCSCGFVACLTCCKTYLLESAAEPRCMKCHRGWTVEFVCKNMTKVFYLNKLRQHMADVLMDRERSLLPATQLEAEERLVRTKREKKIKEILQEIREFREIIQDVKNDYLGLLTREDRDEKRLQKLKAEYIEYRQALVRLEVEEEELHYVQRRVGRDEPGRERKKFMMHCRTEGCRGFLSTQWKCELCEQYSCKDCLESIGRFENKESHKCKKENLESAQLIKKETKPCPSCGVPIFKIQGCDMMWCTDCKTPFSWRTGTILKGEIHNPHYFEWQRQNVRGNAPRRAGDMPCGGMPHFIPEEYSLREWTRFKNMKPDVVWARKIPKEGLDVFLTSIIPFVNHTSQETMIRYRQIDDGHLRELRIKYLLNEIDEDQWRGRLATVQKTNSFRHCVSQVLEMYVAMMVNLFRNITEANPRELSDFAWRNRVAQEVILLLDYASEELEKIRRIYSQKVPILYGENGSKRLSEWIKWAKQSV